MFLKYVDTNTEKSSSFHEWYIHRWFPKAEMFFYAADEVGINYARKYVKKTGNTEAMMYFYINDPKEFADETRVKLLGTYHFYDDARKLLKKKLNLYTRIAMKVADEKNRTKLIHIKL